MNNNIYTLYNSERRRWWHPTPVLLPGKSHGWRSLVGCSPWGSEESDMTERRHFHFSLSCIGEGNGNPLQCSCLENPRDGGGPSGLPSRESHGVGQALKTLSSSSIIAKVFNLWDYFYQGIKTSIQDIIIKGQIS